ncbi:MAG: alpha-xylosidase, partial [Muribaculaceae bacterium]|nr:alpha-xylosidase [Muribaculaceae bacterium]
YTNYTGLRRGDSDFDYVSIGDVNRNGLIDAFDISNVAVKLNGGIEKPAAEVEGELVLTPDRKRYAAGDVVTLTLSGKGLKNVNALSMALPYLPAQYEFVGITLTPEAAKMANLTYDRLHTSGDKVLYPTLVNLGEQPLLNGDINIATITFRARRAGAFSPVAESMILVSPALNAK